MLLVLLTSFHEMAPFACAFTVGVCRRVKVGTECTDRVTGSQSRSILICDLSFQEKGF